MDGNVARMEEVRNLYEISVGKSDGKIPLGKYRFRREDNNKIYLK
jgi:hypothetical protein